VPPFLRRTNGTPLDDLVEIFKVDYPEYHIVTESDLLGKFSEYSRKGKIK